MADSVNKEAKMVNGIGSALAIIGWVGFVAMIAFEIIMIVNLIDASEPLWTELQAHLRSQGQTRCNPMRQGPSGKPENASA